MEESDEKAMRATHTHTRTHADIFDISEKSGSWLYIGADIESNAPLLPMLRCRSHRQRQQTGAHPPPSATRKQWLAHGPRTRAVVFVRGGRVLVSTPGPSATPPSSALENEIIKKRKCGKRHGFHVVEQRSHENCLLGGNCVFSASSRTRAGPLLMRE